MDQPNQPVTLTGSQIAELNQHLSRMRHDVNNHLSLILAAAEIMQMKPDLTQRMLPTFLEQPKKISDEVQTFSALFEQTFGIHRDQHSPDEG